MVYKNIRKLRETFGITSRALAKQINKSEMAYSRLERGLTKVDAETLYNISIVLRVDINIFFDDKLTDSVIKNRELDLEKII